MVIPLIFFIERVVLWIHNGAVALFQGVSLGLLSNAALERLTEYRFSATPFTYAEESYVNSGLFLWEREAINAYFPPTGRILVAAAGAGREMIALSKAGFSVDGFDCCKALVESGRDEIKKLGIRARLDYAPPSTVPALEGPYVAVLVGFSGYMYIPGRLRRIDFLRRLGSLLIADAPLMISFTEGYAGRRSAWTAKVGTMIRKLRRAEPVEEGDCLKGGFQHHFPQQQILSEMSEAGMELVYYAGGTCYGHAVARVRKNEKLHSLEQAQLEILA